MTKGSRPVEDTFERAQRTIGSRLKEARLKAKLTQAELADIAGLTQAYIFNVETQGANLTLKSMARLAEALSIDVRDLLPESRADPLSRTALIQLRDVLDRAAALLEQRQSQEAEILDELRKVASLRQVIARALSESREPRRGSTSSKKKDKGPDEG